MKYLLFTIIALSFWLIASPIEANNCNVQPYANKKIVVVEDHKDSIVFPLNPQYYWSVEDPEREQRIADEVVRRMREMMQQNRKIEGKEHFRVFGGNGSGDPLKSLFVNNCINCHKPGASKPGIALFNKDGSLYEEKDARAERERRRKIWDSVDSGVMPKGRSLTEAQKEQVKRWYLR